MWSYRYVQNGLPWWLRWVKNLPATWKTWVQSLGWEDSPGEGNGCPLQYSCLDNSMDREAWRETVHRVAKKLNMTEWLALTQKVLGKHRGKQGHIAFWKATEVKAIVNTSGHAESWGLHCANGLTFLFTCMMNAQDPSQAKHCSQALSVLPTKSASHLSSCLQTHCPS